MVRRIRRTKRTCLIYCEGAQDKAFLNAVKSVYVTDKLNIDIKSGTGGSQISLVEAAIRLGDGYDEKYIQLDDDREVVEMNEAKRLAEKNNIIVLRTTPCMERILIGILEPSKNINGWPSSRIKKYFQEKYIAENKRSNSQSYSVNFTRPKLENARKKCMQLDDIIKAFL